jgi:hypothetical protein
VLGTGPASVAGGAMLWLDYELGTGGADATYPNAFSGAGTLKITAPATGGTNFSTAILTGDLWDSRHFDRLSGVIPDELRNTDGTLKPFAVVRWENGTEFGQQPLDAESRFVAVYFYEDHGWQNNEVAASRLKKLLQRTLLNADDVALAQVRYVDDLAPFIDEEFGNASAQGSRYEITVYRS